MDGFPATPCRVAASARAGDDAYVVLDTGAEGAPYLYGICLTRRDGGWMEVASGNGPGWTRVDADGDLGTAVAWGMAPRGAVRVRAALGDDVREAPVAGGVYLVAWWRVPEGREPRVEGFMVQGRWIPQRANG